MRLVSYVSQAGPKAGLVIGDRVHDVSSLDGGLPGSVRDLLELEDGLERLAGATAAGDGVALSSLVLAPVVPDPRAVWCAALTFNSHVSEAPGREAPEYPLFFPRVPASQTGHGQPLVLPAVSELLDYEGELAVIIGRRGRHISVGDALGYVAGYSCYNDGSVRDWQRHTSQIATGKNFASTGAFGPWLVTPDEFGDPYQRTITTTVNGETRQQASIDELLFRIEYLIHYISTMHELAPGDVIVCGTPGGVGMRRDPPVFLKPGDTVRVEIDGIGALENEVAAEQPSTPVTWTPAATS